MIAPRRPFPHPAPLRMVAKRTIGIGSAHPETLYKFLQRILQGEGINFIVAPYAASAQVRAKCHECIVLLPRLIIVFSVGLP